MVDETSAPVAKSPGPTRVDWTAAALILLTAVALAFIRAQSVNLPWHLATARLAQATGHWPSQNTFSYTFPDHPVYQQYPVFQGFMWAVLQATGWEGLSAASAVGWIVAFLLFVRWGGPFGRGAQLQVLWLFGLCALQRRMTLRPDLFTMLAFGVELLAFDAFARGRRLALLLVPLAHLFWVNSHQLFPLSFIVQGLFLLEVLRRRDSRSARLVALALAASVLLTFATPLGWRIVLAPLRTAQSLQLFRGNIAEFRRVWEIPLELGLTLATGLPAAWALWRARRVVTWFEVGVWLLSLCMVVSAVRGLMFFGVVSVALFERWSTRHASAGGTLLPPISAETTRALRAIGFALTVVIASATVYYRWVRPPLSLGGTQPGLGRAIGGWSEAGTSFLRETPPPGRMLNLGNGLGDNVIFWAPELPVFVDSRMESYPIDFLRDVIAAETSDAMLETLIARFDVQWVFLEHGRAVLRARAHTLVARGWRAVYLDSANVVLVRPSPRTQEYLRAHTLDLAHAQPGDLVATPALRAQQLESFERARAVLTEP
jgi:hypothetical protein